MSITIGIDFGTSYCSASWINPNTGKPEAIRFKDTELFKIPSVVYISSSNKTIIGEKAINQIEETAQMDDDERDEIVNNTIFSIKTRMSRSNKWLRPGKTYTDEDVIALILKKVKEQVEVSCPINGTIDQVVLTYPVKFDENEEKKDILKHAAALAGFKRVKLIQEPVSAALYVIKTGLVPKTSKGLLVYDFGAGTFDVAYLQPKGDDNPYMPVLPKGDDKCGGDDIDRDFYLDWDRYVQATKKCSVSSEPGETDLAVMYRCRKQKEEISRGDVADKIAIFVPKLGRVRRDINISQFNKLIEPWINRTIEKTRQIVKEIKDKQLPLDHIVLIGGSSKFPMVTQKLQELLGSSVRIVSTGDSDIAVAVGAMYSLNINIQGPNKETVSTKHFCIYCGKPVLSNQKYCMYCGKNNFSYKP